MRLEEERRGDAAIVRPHGSLRAGESAETLEKALGRAETHGPNERVLLLFQRTKLDAVFPVAPTVEAALSGRG
jgi:hypothetical protein